MKKKRKYKITTLDTLKAIRKANRECLVFPKPVVTTDKKKKVNKEACRNWKSNFSD